MFIVFIQLSCNVINLEIIGRKKPRETRYSLFGKSNNRKTYDFMKMGEKSLISVIWKSLP